MHFGPVLRALFHNKTRFWLITLEVALTLAIVVNCLNVILDLRGQYTQPSGVDEANLVVLRLDPFGPDYEDDDFITELEKEDLRRLRAFPGVRDAMATHAVPMSGGGSSTGRKPMGSDLEAITTPYFRVSDHTVSSLGIEIEAGRALEAGDLDFERDENGDILHRNILVTRTLADLLFPDGNAVGQMVENSTGEISNTIVGVVSDMHNSWPHWPEGRFRVAFFPGQAGNARRMTYIVRAEPGAVDSVASGLEELILGVHPDRVAHVDTLGQFREETFRTETASMKMLSAVSVLLLLITSLGIVGLTAFSVTQRTREIGTRRALGATKGDIIRYFLVENWIITGIGLVLGTGLAVALSFVLSKAAGAPKLDWMLLAGGMVLLWITGIVAALIPALRATRVAPEVATRTV